MNIPSWRIPPSVITHLDHIPYDQPVVLLLRHSVREKLPPGEAGNLVPITETGQRIAVELGALLGDRLKTLHTSPILRCVQTSEAIHRGARAPFSIVNDRLLGDPGVYVLDGKQAWMNWETLGHEGVVNHLVAETTALPGMARPEEAARSLVAHMFSVASGVPGVHVFVTHDSLVIVTAARLLEKVLRPADWPWYLEGAFFWHTADGLKISYRDYVAYVERRLSM
ncbi:MAG: histidine phosphatase family protein [Myxococcales bacterium]|nr:histidine phosphatase family protein [Myxococcales bacterium]